MTKKDMLSKNLQPTNDIIINTAINTAINTTDVVVPKKRGRKPKSVIESEKQLQIQNKENIDVSFQETTNSDLKTNLEETIDIINSSDDIESAESIDNLIILTDSLQIDDTKPIAKKRGRKPKGGKIIQNIIQTDSNNENKPNIILHLKCSLKDLHSNVTQEDDVNGFEFSDSKKLTYDLINENSKLPTNNSLYGITHKSQNYDGDDNYDEDKPSKENDIRDIWKKLKSLEHNLHINNICDKKSACFWCTHDFDNPPIYIPKFFIKDSYHVYGCFCSPECATAYLMEENIDSSSKFERYHLINHVYSKIYDYKKNIKPAPNPYYMLDKYYGNLSIQEYRTLLRNDRLFLIVDKPLTRILPELHEDNDDFIINNKIIPSNTYQIKKKLQRNQTKNNILNERFGLSQQ